MFDLYTLYREAGHDAARINHAASTERDRLQAVIYARTGIDPSVGAAYAPGDPDDAPSVHLVTLSTMVNGNLMRATYRDDTREVEVRVNGGPVTPRDRKATRLAQTVAGMVETFHHYIDAYASAERARREMFGQSAHPWFPVAS